MPFLLSWLFMFNLINIIRKDVLALFGNVCLFFSN